MQNLKILKSFTFWLVTCLVLLLGYAYSYTASALAQSLSKSENRRARHPVKSIYLVDSAEVLPVFKYPQSQTVLTNLRRGEPFMVIKIYRDWAYGQTESNQTGYVAKKNLTLLKHEQ